MAGYIGLAAIAVIIWLLIRAGKKKKVTRKKGFLGPLIILGGTWYFLFTYVSPVAPGHVVVQRVIHASGGNKGLIDAMAASAPYYWTGNERTCLDDLWWRESGYSNTADTRVTHAGGDGPGSAVFAYGIAQARPASKYPLAGRPPDMGGSSDPGTQIRWGLAYIHSSYGTPCGAWSHEEANSWY